MTARPKLRKILYCEMTNGDMFAAVEYLNSEMPNALDAFIAELRAGKEMVERRKAMTKCKYQSITGSGCLHPSSPTRDCWVYQEYPFLRPYDDCKRFEDRWMVEDGINHP